MHPLARNTDPETSHEAAADIKDSGRQAYQKQAVVKALRQAVGPLSPYPTSAELASFAGMDRYVVARRLPDLEKDGLVEKVVINGAHIKRKCKVTCKTATVWRVKI